MSQVAIPQSQDAAVEKPKRGRILIVEDDAVQATALGHRLHKQGFEVLTAGDGQSGLETARQHHPQLVLLDLRLPDMDGLGVCQVLADDPVTCDVPVIIVSGLERPDIIRSARAAGCRYYVRKPYDPNALLTLIQDALVDRETWGT